jgi:hypothetical protein
MTFERERAKMRALHRHEPKAACLARAANGLNANN